MPGSSCGPRSSRPRGKAPPGSRDERTCPARPGGPARHPYLPGLRDDRPVPGQPVPAGMGSPRQPARSRVPGLWPADGCVRPAVPVPGQTQQVRMAAHEAAAQAGMAAAAATARPVVLRHAGAVLAMTSGLDTSVPNMARIYNYWLGGKDHFAADRAEADRLVDALPAAARAGPGEPGVPHQGCPVGSPAGHRAVHRPGCRASGLSVGPPGRAGGPARSPGRLCRYRPGGADPCRGAAGHRRWRGRR